MFASMYTVVDSCRTMYISSVLTIGIYSDLEHKLDREEDQKA